MINIFANGDENNFRNIFEELKYIFEENISIICHVREKETEFINYLKKNSFYMLGSINLKSDKLITYIFDGSNLDKA